MRALIGGARVGLRLLSLRELRIPLAIQIPVESMFKALCQAQEKVHRGPAADRALLRPRLLLRVRRVDRV